MGIDYYTCANCRDTFPDCISYFSCENCGQHFCSNKCGKRQVSEPPDDIDDDADWEETVTCIFCRTEAVTDDDMIDFLLKELNITYDQALERYKQAVIRGETDDGE